MIIWITGLSGAGKTTIGRELYAMLKRQTPNVVMLDGDEMRNLFQLNQFANPYSAESRRLIGLNYHRVCAWLERQDIHVVCCTIGGNQSLRDQNRQVFKNYLEVFVDVPVEVLAAYDDKNLYRRALNGETHDVVGVDIEYPPPTQPDLVIDNSTRHVAPHSLALMILESATARFRGVFSTV